MKIQGDTDPDRSWIEKAKDGDFEAFEHLVSKYERRLYTLTLRILRQPEDAEEAVQETFLSILNHLGSFRGEAKFSSWLVRIATNHALKILRKRRGFKAVPLEDAGSGGEDRYGDIAPPQYIAAWKEHPGRLAQEQQLEQILAEALEQLDEKYRFVFLLRDVEGLSTEETAEVLGIGLSNVKVRLLRARLMLRERLTRIFGDEATQLFSPHFDGPH